VTAWAPERRSRRSFYTILCLGILVGLLLPGVFARVVSLTGLADHVARPLQRPDTQGNADAIVVLGAGVDPTCDLNNSAYRRTLLAVRLFQGHRSESLVFTGGPTESSGGTPVSRHMADLARALGVPGGAIVEEDRSTSTWENAAFTSGLLRERGASRILLVTDSLHMGRAERCFLSFGFEIERASVPPMCVSSSNVDLLRYAAREYAAWAWYALRGHESPPASPEKG
jgi:uncharacterized SAM-binding protein YcdF (DUF218 family)